MTLFGLALFYSYPTIISLRPQGIHQWRQADCLSLSHTYFEEANNFFQPAIHNLAEDGSGKTATDFPLLYYLIAQLWKIFGPSEILFRLIVMAIMFTGCVFLFRTAEEILKDSIWALIIVLVLFSSPTLVYYTNNFLMDIPALGLSFIAWSFVYRFIKGKKNINFYLAMIFFLIAGWLKISALLSFIALFIIFLYVTIFDKGKNYGNQLLHGKKYLVLFLLVIASIAAWYIYAHYYNKNHNEGYFLIGILPIWDVSADIFNRMFDAIKYHIREDYFHPILSLVLVVCWICIIIWNKRINRFIVSLSVLISVGMILYLLLFFQALESHDYYTINLTILIPFICIGFLLLIKSATPDIFTSIYPKIMVLCLLMFCFSFTQTRMQYRYSTEGWENENRTKYTYAFETIEPYLESIGINKEDKVISYPDQSINITLYLMNRKGWTKFNLFEDPEKVHEKIKQGAKYLLSYKKEGEDLDIFEDYLGPEVGRYNNVTIYTLQTPDHAVIE